MLTIIIPSHNEENHISSCLQAILAQANLPASHGMQVIVAANGCQDNTVAIAQARAIDLRAAGFDTVVLDIEYGNKINALNESERVAIYNDRVFIDADVVISPCILRELADHLARDTPIYASGDVRVPRPQSIVSRAFAKVWTNLPYFRDGVSGIGLYAVNEAGRARWGAFPAIIADDFFVRLQFEPNERRKTNATYQWPLPEGFANLVNVRHRWKEGNLELAKKYPALLANDSEINSNGWNAIGLLRMPFSAAIYVLIYAISNRRARQSVNTGGSGWLRGRN